MDITAFKTQSHDNAIRRDVDRYGVAEYALDITTHGFTVVPPEKLGVAGDWIKRLRDAVTQAHGQRHDIDSDHCRRMMTAKASHPVESFNLVEEAALNPVGLALIRLLLGRGAFMASHNPVVRCSFDPAEPDSDLLTPEGYLPLHNDAHGIALGSGSESHGLKAAWLCTDHTEESDGPIIVAPDTFRLGRVTLPHELDPLRSPHPVVHLTGKAGSLAIWHGGAFHGMAPRTKAGSHVMLLQDWFRPYMARQAFWEDVPIDLAGHRVPVLDQVAGLDVDSPLRLHPEASIDEAKTPEMAPVESHS